MSVLSDAIEAFLLRQMEEGSTDIRVSRRDLAELFGCAPSQINYVLSTRFTPAHGYFIESQRGGGGYIRILRMVHDDGDEMLSQAMERCVKPLSEYEAKAMLQNLCRSDFITAREAAIMISVLTDAHVKTLTEDPDSLRSDFMIRMIAALRIQRKKENGNGSL